MRLAAENLKIMVDCFSGASGGFLPLRFLLEEMEQRVTNSDDLAAFKILEIADNFASLILTAEKLHKEELLKSL